jgi:3-deoxy-D-manno-octulosonate 8-phosphate phosphatase (KDO 8-P phosphatase)
MHSINIDDIAVIVFDFDGVLTDNRVYLNANGEEFVVCNRSDGLAFDVLRKLNKPFYLLSTEKDLVVSARAKKINASVMQGIKDKTIGIKEIADKENCNLDNILYIGNDINDYQVMKLCGYTVCPADGHEKIKQISTITLETKGGCGIVRELLEKVFNLDLIEILYKE